MKSIPFVSRRELAVNYGALLSGTAAARLLAGLTMILIARQVGSAQYGQFAGSLALAKVASSAFALGLESWLLRNGLRDGDRSLLSRLSTAVLAITAGLGLIWLAVFALFAPALNQDSFPYIVLMLCALSVWCEELINVVSTTFKTALQNTVTFAIITGTQLLLFLLVLGQMGLGQQMLLPYLYVRVGGMAVAAIIAVWWMSRTVTLHIQWPDIPATLRGAPPFAISLGLALIYERADVAIIALALGQEQTGLYAPATTIIIALFLIPGTLFGVMVPALSRIHAQEPARLMRMMRLLLAGSLGLAVLLTVTVYLSAHFVINLLFGPDYTASGDVLAVLSGVLAFRCLTFTLAALLIAVGWQKWRLVPQALAAGLNVGLNFLIIGTYGIMGVAYVYVLTEALLMAGYLALVVIWRRRSRLHAAPV